MCGFVGFTGMTNDRQPSSTPYDGRMPRWDAKSSIIIRPSQNEGMDAANMENTVST